MQVFMEATRVRMEATRTLCRVLSPDVIRLTLNSVAFLLFFNPPQSFVAHDYYNITVIDSLSVAP